MARLDLIHIYIGVVWSIYSVTLSEQGWLKACHDHFLGFFEARMRLQPGKSQGTAPVPAGNLFAARRLLKIRAMALCCGLWRETLVKRRSLVVADARCSPHNMTGTLSTISKVLFKLASLCGCLRAKTEVKEQKPQ